MTTVKVVVVIIVAVSVLIKDVIGDCKDNDWQCSAWRNRGYCDMPGWKADLKTKCQLSCGYCSTGSMIGNCGISKVASSRIVRGKRTKRGAWPWMASITKFGIHWCGGSLVTNKWVLTAAHCFDNIQKRDLPNWGIKLGEHDHRVIEAGEQTYDIKRLIIHPKYDHVGPLNDIALIELKRRVPAMTRYIQTICLPSSKTTPSASSRCVLAGWGSVRHPGPPFHTLQEAKLPIVSNEACGNHPDFICAGHGPGKLQNACGGDSGGPFFCYEGSRWVQHGVTSYVTTYCKDYTAFTQVSAFVDWIKKNVPGI